MKNNIRKLYIKSCLNPYLNRKTLYEENRNLSGIYCWYNLITHELYLGSSINLIKRLYRYLSIPSLEQENLKYNSYIHKAVILKYNYNNFSFNILEYCVSASHPTNE